MSKIYIVSTKKTGKSRLVRANTMNQAMRFVSCEIFNVRGATHDEIYAARGDEIANAVAPEQTDIDDKKDTP